MTTRRFERRLASLLPWAVTAVLWGSAAAAPLSPRFYHAACFDPSRGDMIVFGGTNGAGAFYDDVWRLSLGGAPAWTSVPVQDSVPSPRVGSTAIYDPVRDRVVVIGGWAFEGQLVPVDEVWALSLSVAPAWSRIHPAGAGPAPRGFHTAIYDPVRDRIVVFGGSDPSGDLFSDVWSLRLSPDPAWEPLAVLPGPSERDHHVAIYDPPRDRMLIFSGAGGALNDLWALGFSATPTWTRLHPAGENALPQLSGHAAVYDPIGQRMVVFGGNDGNLYRNDVWSLSLGGPLAWSSVSVGGPSPSPRGSPAAVYDSAYRRMIVFGGYPDDDAPTWGLPLAPAARWSPWGPTLDVAPARLELSPVTRGDTVSAAFTISNVGLQPLRIDAVDGPATPGMRLAAAPPATLAWNQSAADTLVLAATDPDSGATSFVIASNDSTEPQKLVPIAFQVRDLDVATRVLGAPDTVPLGVSFDVVVTPRPGVRIERGTLYYRIADSGSPYDSEALAQLSTDYIATVPASAVTEHGVEYYVAVANGDFVAFQPRGAPAIVERQRVAAPTSITAQPRPSSGVDFLSDREIPVDVLLPSGASFASGAIHYRRGGETSFATAPVTPSPSGGPPAGTIPADAVGPRGVDYWVQVATLDAVLRFPAAEGATRSIPVRVHGLTEAAEHPGGRFRLLSVPVDFGADFRGTLYDVLADQLGTYAPQRWRAFAFDAATQRNAEFPSAVPGLFRPDSGRAFWLITRDPHRVNTLPIDGFSTYTAAAFPIALAHGWNLIGDPFDFPVAWADVRRDTDFVGDPVGFDPTLPRTDPSRRDPSLPSRGDYVRRGAATVLQPFDGYFVHADRPETLWVPPRESPAAAAGGAAPASVAGGWAWRLRVEAYTGDAVDGANELGVAAGALEGFDRRDAVKPPAPPGPWVRLAFIHPDWGEHAGAYGCDLRAPGTDGETWELEVRSEAPGDLVTIEVSSEIAPPASDAVRLVDVEQGTTLDVGPRFEDGTSRSVAIVGYGPGRPYRLAILAGTADYVARSSSPSSPVPARCVLDATAPNPFAAATRIRFALPRDGAATLEVYDVLGHRVATLLDRANLAGGYHSAVWDGTTTTGARVPSGVYLIRLAAGAEISTRRVVRIR